MEKGEAKLFSRFLKETGAPNILIIIAYFQCAIQVVSHESYNHSMN